MTKHSIPLFACSYIFLFALSASTVSLARGSAAHAATATNDEDVENLEPLLIQGQVMEFSPMQIVELRTRILAEGLKNPRGCDAELKPLLVCRVVHQNLSRLKAVRCSSNADYCQHVSKLQGVLATHRAGVNIGSGHGPTVPTATFDFALNQIANDNFNSYFERTSYAKLKHQVAALPGKPEDNMQQIESLVGGWPPMEERPSIEALHGFAKAYVAIAAIGKRMDPLLQQAKNEAARRAAQRREDAAFGAAISDQGLSADQYNQISDDTQHYFLLKKTVLRFIKKVRDQASSASDVAVEAP